MTGRQRVGGRAGGAGRIGLGLVVLEGGRWGWVMIPVWAGFMRLMGRPVISGLDVVKLEQAMAQTRSAIMRTVTPGPVSLVGLGELYSGGNILLDCMTGSFVYWRYTMLYILGG